MTESEGYTAGSPVWKPQVLAAQINVSLERGDLGWAKDVLKTLSAWHADHGATEKLTLPVLSTEEEESK